MKRYDLICGQTYNWVGERPDGRYVLAADAAAERAALVEQFRRDSASRDDMWRRRQENWRKSSEADRAALVERAEMAEARVTTADAAWRKELASEGVGTFEEAWAEKEQEGYQYGEDALEQVRMGWELRRSRAESERNALAATLEQVRAALNAKGKIRRWRIDRAFEALAGAPAPEGAEEK